MPYTRRKSHLVRNVFITLLVLVVVIVSFIEVGNMMNKSNTNTGSTKTTGTTPTGNNSNSTGPQVLLETSMGNITIQLYSDMPITSGNFLNLTEHGIYDGTLFSRVSKGFVIQGGDATPKGINVPPIKDELPNKHSNIQGSVAMAKTSQPNSATSQFFINLANNSAALDSNYSVFGQVIAGWDTVVKISQVSITPGLSATDGSPIQPVIIYHAIVVG